MTPLGKRMEIERKVVRHLIRTMKKHRWRVYKTYDGEEWEPTTTETEVINVVFSVDESIIRFKKQYGTGYNAHNVVIVLGNDGWDCITDYGYANGDDFAEIMVGEVDPYCEKLEE